MQFGDFWIRNFQRLEEARMSLYKQGAILICGDNRDGGGANAAGKSTLVNAILWVLSGRTMQGLVGPQVSFLGPTEGYLDVIQPGGLFRVNRFADSTKHTILVSKSEGEQWKTVIDAPVGEGQKALDMLLGAPHDLLVNSIFSGQGKDTEFSGLTSAKMKEVFELFLGLGVFTDAQENMKDYSKTVQPFLQAAQLRTSEFRSKIEVLTNQRKVSQQSSATHAETTSARIATLQGEKDTLRARHEQEGLGLSVEISDLEDMWNAKSSDHANLSLALIPKKGLQETRASYETTKIEVSAREASERTSLRSIDDQLKKCHDLLKQGHCAVCGSDIQQSQVPTTVKELEAQRAQHDEAHQRAREAVQQVTEQIRGLDVQVSRVTSIEQKVTQLRADLQTSEQALASKKELLGSMNSPMNPTLQRLTQIDQEIQALMDQVNPFVQTILGIDLALGTLAWNERMADVDYGMLQGEMAHIQFWLDGFGQGGMRSHHLKKVTPYLNQRVQHYVGQLLPGSVVTFETIKTLKSGELRDNFHVDLALKDGAGQYKGASGGEGQCVNVAVALAMQDLCAAIGGVGVELCILDEVCTNLHSVWAGRVAQLLCTLQERGTILVVSNNEEFIPYFQKRMTIRKEGGIARLVDD